MAEQEKPRGEHPEVPPTPVNPLAEDASLVADFILESREHLATVEGRMMSLERNPSDVETIHEVFRCFHTIKGLAGFLDLADIGDVAHHVETLLDLARNAKLTVTSPVVDAVLASADYLKQAIHALESFGAGALPDTPAAKARLVARIQKFTADSEEGGDPGEICLLPEAPVQQDGGASAGGTTAGKVAGEFSVRVDTAKLDYLVEMVGEMVIAQALVRHNPALESVKDPRLHGALSQLARITSEVQRTSMGIRMIPIGQLFQRTGRVVRDLSRKSGKHVALEISGEDTELDKTIAEELSDPLLHMVRNCIDHGIEPPEAREAAGKSRTAQIRLAASYHGGQIAVEVSDDGRGLDRDKILEKARRSGLVAGGARLTDPEIYSLVFEPGFSTADKITDVSGRGVGMDVVHRRVQKLRGRIDIHSRPGQGATFFIRLPLTLAIIEGLVVGVGAEHYIVPIYAVKEIFRPEAESVSTIQGRGEMVLVRGELRPVVRLYRRFQITPESEDPLRSLMVVAECQGKTFCLMVDRLIGKQEVVIKSLGENLKSTPGVAGGAILGDGRVGLILDVEGVYRGDRA